MPIVIVRRPISTEHRGNRGRHFDRTVAALAADINALRAAGVLAHRHLAEALNAAGKRTPGGNPFSHTTVRRFLKRMAELHLGAGPRSPKSAANRRRPRRYMPRLPRPTRHDPKFEAVVAQFNPNTDLTRSD